jgi:hypothetical protein
MEEDAGLKSGAWGGAAAGLDMPGSTGKTAVGAERTPSTCCVLHGQWLSHLHARRYLTAHTTVACMTHQAGCPLCRVQAHSSVCLTQRRGQYCGRAS